MPILGILASAITGNLVTSSYESIATIIHILLYMDMEVV
jgi:hypothetical protein